MAEHLIVPIDQDQIPVPKKRQNRRQNNSLVLNVKTSLIHDMSIIKTAKRNDLNVEKYLTYLLEKMPNEENLDDMAVLEGYLPWAKEIQENCKNLVIEKREET